MTCSDRIWHFDKQIAILEKKAIFMLQKHSGFRVFLPSATFGPKHNFKHSAWVAFSNILTKFSFELEEKVSVFLLFFVCM
jgi:hypothetical protein